MAKKQSIIATGFQRLMSRTTLIKKRTTQVTSVCVLDRGDGGQRAGRYPGPAGAVLPVRQEGSRRQLLLPVWTRDAFTKTPQRLKSFDKSISESTLLSHVVSSLLWFPGRWSRRRRASRGGAPWSRCAVGRR